MAITDERHEDLQHLIRRQIISPEVTARRTGRLPCTNRLAMLFCNAMVFVIECHIVHLQRQWKRRLLVRKFYLDIALIKLSADIRCRAPWLKDRVASTKAIGQFPCAPNA